MERVNVLKSWEAIENCLKFFGESLCGVFDLSCVESCAKRQKVIEHSFLAIIPLILEILKPARI